MRLLWTVQRYGSNIVGGSEQATRMFAEKMVARGHEVTVLTSCAESYTDWANVFKPGQTTENGVEVVRLPVAGPRNQELFEPLHSRVLSGEVMPVFEQKRWAQAIGPDLLNFVPMLHELCRISDVAIFKAYLYNTATAGICGTAGRVPVVFHPEVHPEEMLNLPIFDSIFRLVNAFQFNSVEERHLIERRFRIQPHGEIVGIGVDNEQFEVPEDSANIRRGLGLEEGQYFVALGRVSDGKGSFELMEQFQRLASNGVVDAQLIFVGEQPDHLPHMSSVRFTGFVSEETKRAILAGAAGLIQPSRLESFSIVLTESWALSRPVVVQKASEVLLGHVVRSGGGYAYANESELGIALARLLHDADKRESLGRAGCAYVSMNYRWDLVLDRFERVLESAQQEFLRNHRR
jgi:glycosyltransferase involved in cell wall biosynthesis